MSIADAEHVTDTRGDLAAHAFRRGRWFWEPSCGYGLVQFVVTGGYAGLGRDRLCQSGRPRVPAAVFSARFSRIVLLVPGVADDRSWPRSGSI